MFHKLKGPSIIYVSKAHFETGENLQEDFKGCSHPSALFIAGTVPHAVHLKSDCPPSQLFSSVLCADTSSIAQARNPFSLLCETIKLFF